MIDVLSLCSGIGGIEFGLRRTGGFRSVCYVEKDPWCVAVLIARMQDGLLDEAPIHGDIETFDGESWRGVVDCVTAGFPCQPVSVAGRGLGEADPRWLWPHIIRVVRDVRPRLVLLENVPGLLVRGMGRVLADLAESGYDCQWDRISAAAVGANHLRRRVFIVGYSEELFSDGGFHYRGSIEAGKPIPSVSQPRDTGCKEDVAHSEGLGLEGLSISEESCGAKRRIFAGSSFARAIATRISGAGWWAVEPSFCGMANGISKKLDEVIDAYERWLSLSCPKTEKVFLRDVWLYYQVEHPPQRRMLGKQFALEYPNLMRSMSHKAPLENRQEALAEIRGFLFDLRQGINSWDVRNASKSLKEAWESLSCEAKDWVGMEIDGGPWYCEWPDTPRVASGVKHPVDRLRALGNAVVPQVAEAVGRMILEWLALPPAKEEG